jgi:hypothetical protein
VLEESQINWSAPAVPSVEIEVQSAPSQEQMLADFERFKPIGTGDVGCSACYTINLLDVEFTTRTIRCKACGQLENFEQFFKRYRL